MELTVFGSNSAGNMYLLENDNEALLIEAGMRFVNIKRKLGNNISKISGCVITHAHHDHGGYVLDVLKAGINVYTSQGTIDKMRVDSHRLKPVQANEMFTCGNFKIIPFDVAHDCKEPYGYYINHPETGNILFVTDTFYIPNLFKGMSHVIIEANFDKNIIQENFETGKIHLKVYERVHRSHMEIKTVCEFLKASDLSQVNNILLIHLSESNSNAKEFKSKIEGLTGKQTHIASKGLSINLSKKLF